jgi:hypothetical protein
MLLDTDKIDDAALALFYLTLHDGVAVGRVSLTASQFFVVCMLRRFCRNKDIAAEF